MCNIEEIASALAFLNEAQIELERAVNDCSGTPGYYCASQYERRDRAREALKSSLDNYIDGRIKEILFAAKDAIEDD
jgi:predicted acetyltransferase